MAEAEEKRGRKRGRRGGKYWDAEKQTALIDTALGSEPVGSNSFVTSAMVAITWDSAWTPRVSKNIDTIAVGEQVAVRFAVSKENVQVRERKFLLTVDYTFSDDHKVFSHLRVQDWQMKVSRFCQVQAGVDFKSLCVSVAKGKVVFTMKVCGRCIRKVADSFMDSQAVFT
jgi:hypothetical protein